MIMKISQSSQRTASRSKVNCNAMIRSTFLFKVLISTVLMIYVQSFTAPSSRIASISKTTISRIRRLKEHEGDYELPKQEYNPNSDYEIQLGRVLNALKRDYPDILVADPDYSIYSDSILAKDPSGFKVNGLNNYKQAFALVHTVVNVFYCPEMSLLTFKMIHDKCHNNIRVSWNAEVVPKQIFGGTKTTLHVDGISVYELNMKGKVQRHHIQNLLINNQPLVKHDSLLDALRAELSTSQKECAPVFTRADERMAATTTLPSKNKLVRFAQQPFFSESNSLFSPDEELTRTSLVVLSAVPHGQDNSLDSNDSDLDWDKFERRNQTRKKFGVKPLTADEFMKLESEVKELESQQIKKYPSNTDATQMPSPKKNSPIKGFLTKVFGEVFEDTCESNYDCKRPEVCCDFKFKKICCSSGQMMKTPEPVMVTIKSSSDNDGDYYRGR